MPSYDDVFQNPIISIDCLISCRFLNHRLFSAKWLSNDNFELYLSLILLYIYVHKKRDVYGMFMYLNDIRTCGDLVAITTVMRLYAFPTKSLVLLVDSCCRPECTGQYCLLYRYLQWLTIRSEIMRSSVSRGDQRHACRVNNKPRGAYQHGRED